MKIGVVLDEYMPQDGGAFTLQEDVLTALIELAPQSSHQFEIISPPSAKTVDKLKSSGIGWIPYRAPGWLEKATSFFGRNWPKLRRRFHWQSSLERRARRAGIEFLWFLGQRTHDIDLPYMTIVFDLQHRLQPWFPEVSQFGEWQTRELAIARHLRRAAAIITGTQAGKEEIASFYQIPQNRIHPLAHPTPSYALRIGEGDGSNALSRFGLQPGFLFYPAQFWAHKNHVNLLLALKILNQKGLKIPLILAGSDFGNLDFVKSQVKEMGLSEQVKFVGFVDQKDLVGLYKNALALTYLSFFGPENLPPLEAFALGCPVIAANVNGSEEQLGEAAILVNPADPQKISLAIEKLRENNVFRDQLIARGRKRAGSWTSKEFVLGAFQILDGFAPIRRTWD